MLPVLLYMLVFLGISILLFRILIRILLPLFLLVVVGALVMTVLAPKIPRRRDDRDAPLGTGGHEPRGGEPSFPDFENRGPVIDVRSETIPEPGDDPNGEEPRK